jgi:hypothetical protein
MKKIFSFLALVSVLGVMLVPVFASAQGATTCQIRHGFSIGTVTCAVGTCTFGQAAGGTISADTPANCSQCCMVDLIYTITDWIFLILMGLAIVFILIGAFNFITAGGSPEKATTGRNYLIYAVVGIMVALLAKAIPTIAKGIVGIG